MTPKKKRQEKAPLVSSMEAGTLRKDEEDSQKKSMLSDGEPACNDLILIMGRASDLLESAQAYHSRLEDVLRQEKETHSETEKDGQEPGNRYPTRSTPDVYYDEEIISSDEESLLTFEPKRKEYSSQNNMVKSDSELYKGKETLPPFLSMLPSGIKNAGVGIWTEASLRKGTVFGPYPGTVVVNPSQEEKSDSSWQVCRDSRLQYYVEDFDTNLSDWMKYVNYADCKKRQNLVAFQHQGDIYYKTCRTVKSHTELLVWYEDKYAKDIGVKFRRVDDEKCATSVGFECDICHVLLADEECLSRHKKSHPHQGHDRRHCCSYCLYSTSSNVNLKLHQRTHTGVKPYQCQTCGREFARKDSLGRHVLIHTGERPFKCRVCLKSFNDRTHLRTHERKHSQVRPYLCALCGKKFIQHSNLKRHELIHKGQRPHKCPHCPYRATQKSTVLEHVIGKHTREFRHVCSYCRKGFLKLKDLRHHVEMRACV